MPHINVVSDKPHDLRCNINSDNKDEDSKSEDSDTDIVPKHNDIYTRRPEYNYLMEKYERQKSKEIQRNQVLEEDHKTLFEHKHFRPIFNNSDQVLNQGDNYMMQDYNEKNARRRFKELLEKNRQEQLLGHNKTNDDMLKEAMFREMELEAGDQAWDRKYHAKKGDTYLQQKHRDFDKYWKQQEGDWNERFHDAGDWRLKTKSHHHKGRREINHRELYEGRDPYDALPQTLYPHYDKYWSHKWFDHYHDFEKSKKMTLAYHHRYHNETLNLEDYYHIEIRNMGPEWWLKHLKRQLETEPRSINTIGNVSELIIKNFPIVIFTARYEKDHKKVLNVMEKFRKKAEVMSDAVISIELDNSRAGLKIFSDLRHYSPIAQLPQVWFNGRLLGSYDTIKKLKKLQRLVPLLREAEFEGKMPCEMCQAVSKDWYTKWHRQHYPYFDRNLPYEGWS